MICRSAPYPRLAINVCTRLSLKPVQCMPVPLCMTCRSAACRKGAPGVSVFALLLSWKGSADLQCVINLCARSQEYTRGVCQHCLIAGSAFPAVRDAAMRNAVIKSTKHEAVSCRSLKEQSMATAVCLSGLSPWRAVADPGRRIMPAAARLAVPHVTRRVSCAPALKDSMRGTEAVAC